MGMTSFRGSVPPNGNEPPPSTILAQQLVNGQSNSSELDQTSFDQLLEESLGNDENGQPNIGASESVNARLIQIITTAGIDSFIQDRKINPFQSNGVATKSDSRFSCCIEVIQTAVERAPGAIFIAADDRDNAENRVPLFATLLPKLTSLLVPSTSTTSTDAISKLLGALLAERNNSENHGANVVVFDFLLGCASGMLDYFDSSQSPALSSKPSLRDEIILSRLWKYRGSCHNISQDLSFATFADLLHAVTVVVTVLSRHAPTQAQKLQVRKITQRLQHFTEDSSSSTETSDSLIKLQSDLGHFQLQSFSTSFDPTPIPEDDPWPDSDRARKRPRLSDLNDPEQAPEGMSEQLIRKLTVTLNGHAVADFDGLSKTAPSSFKRMTEEQQASAVALIGSTACRLSTGSATSPCLACEGEHTWPTTTSPASEGLIPTLLAVIPTMQRSSRARVTAMCTLRQLLIHTFQLSDLKLTQSAAGEWCLQCLRSSSRDLRLAAIGVLQVYVRDNTNDASITRDNRIVALDFLHSLWSKNEAALQETAVLALTRMALVVGDEELNLILLRLIEYLGHNNSYISGLVYEELQQLAQAKEVTCAVLFRPFWRTLGPAVAKTMNGRRAVAEQLCGLLGMQPTGLMILIEEHALPYLVLNQQHGLMRQFASAHGSSTTLFDLCTNPRILPSVLSHLLAQGYPDAVQKVMELLLAISDDFGVEDLAGWLAHDPIQIACNLLKAIGDMGDGRSSRPHQALQLLAQTLARKPGQHTSSSKRSEVMGAFLESHALAIVTHFTVLLNDLDIKEPKLEKKRCLLALGEIVKLGKGRVSATLPQICACLRSALEDDELGDTGFIAWKTVVSSLKDDDLEPLIDQTFAIIVKSWGKLNSITQMVAYDLVADLLKKHTSLVREIFDKMPSLSSIPIMKKFEAEIETLKKQMDERHQLIAFVERLRSENELVIEQALDELSPLLRLKQDLLHRSILREQPDVFIADLARALLDCSVRFQSNPQVSRLCGQCLGSIGCLDPNKIENTVERKTILVLSNFGKAEETIDFVIFFLEHVLVKAFLSAPTTRAQGFLAWAMQELLKLCGDDDTGGPRIRSGSSHRRWQDLPEGVRSTLTPFLTSKYRVQEVRPPERHIYPYFKPGMRHKDWLRAVVMDFLSRAPGNNVEIIFGICCRIIQGQDASVPAFLLPYVVLNLVISGVNDDGDQITKEVLNILKQLLTGQDRKVQEDIKQCSQSVFEVLDYMSRWLQLRKKQYSNHLARAERSTSEIVLENARAEIRSVEAMLERIPPDLISQRAIECKSYARALFHWEQHMRRSTKEANRDQDLARLQAIYAQIDEPDGIEGISAQMHIVDVEGRVLEHKKAGRWTAAQSWYQMKLAEAPNDFEIQRNLMECLAESGQFDLLLDRYEGIALRTNSTPGQLKPYAIEAAWSAGRWKELSRLISHDRGEDFSSHVGAVLNSMQHGSVETEGISELFRVTATELTPNAISSFQNSHDVMLRLQVVDDIRIITEATPETRSDTLNILEKRLEVLGSNVHDKQYILGIRRAAMRIRKDIFHDNDIAKVCLTSARLARKARASTQAFDAVLRASALGDKSAAIEEAKLMWQEGNHRKAIQALDGAIESGAFVAHDYIAEDGLVTLTTEQQNYQNEVTAKAYLLLGKWLDQAGQTQSEVIKNTFRKSTENYRRWEKGWYYLGRHYNKLLDSEKAMPPGKESQTYLTGEMSKMVIENYMRSLMNGSKYVFQTLPKVLTLWFELVAGADQPHDSRRGNEKFNQHNAAMRKRVIEDTHAYIKKYVDRIQPAVLYTILAQVIARICHTNTAVYSILQTIVVKVVKSFPNQALWTLLATVKSQSKDRANRGLVIISKVVEAQKKSSKDLSPSELRNMITAGQRFSDEVLRISDYTIEGKVSRVSLARDLGFNHKIAPSRLVVPSESCLIPSIPTSYDSTYLKSFRAFAKEPVTISAFQDEALVLSSLQKPRKLSIRGSDGNIYGVLAKPKDDMRKDQRLMEFNTMINRFLKRDVEASKRRLYIRTYAVIPLNEECGLIEWVNNLKTFRDIILKLYKEKAITPNYTEIRNMLDEASSGPPEKVPIFSQKILKNFPAVFHEWFVESFTDPSTWFNARLRYTRACAVMSIVGHVLGLGDRHGENILFEEDNGSLMHVDFNCLFDKGLTFEKPEHVPFRLTHNMVDAMGQYGYEGPFRHCSEITLQLLRSNEDALMTILETFLHDPTTDFIEKERRKKKQIPGVPNTPMEVLEGVTGKVRGYLIGESVPLSVGGYAEEMIKRATDEKNLGRMYIGWCAFF